MRADVVLDELLRQADVDPAKVDRRDINNVARHLADGKARAAIVISGWGAHEARFTSESLGKIVDVLHRFNNHRMNGVAGTPRILLAAVPPSHSVKSKDVGSLLQLTPIAPAAVDVARLATWAQQRLAVNTSELKELLHLAAGQFYAIQAALREVSQQDRVKAIRRSHKHWANAVLAAVGPCCADVLRGVSNRRDCVSALQDGGVLGHDEEPIVAAWKDVWITEPRKAPR